MVNVLHSFNTTKIILSDELNLQSASKKLFVDLIPYGECFALKYHQFNILTNTLLKALKVNK